MNKSLIALATAALAIAATVSSADAGFRVRLGFGGPLPGFTAYGNSNAHTSHRTRRVYRAARTHEKPPASVTRKSQTDTNVAKIDDKTETPVAQNENSSIAEAKTVAQNENSSVTVAAVEPAEVNAAEPAQKVEPVKTAEPKKIEPAVVQKVDCKKFFPSVGMTLTVPCE